MKCQKPHFELHSTGTLGENGNSTALPRHLDKETGKLFVWFGGFFCLIFTEFFNLNTPWLPWLLQGGPFLLAGDSGSAGRLAPAFPWLFGPCCPSHPCRDLTFPQQLCHSHNNWAWKKGKAQEQGKAASSQSCAWSSCTFPPVPGCLFWFKSPAWFPTEQH